MTLDRYHEKRDFKATPEPRGKVGRKAPSQLAYLIQKHEASHLHYDFRLELDGVLLSWAVPKGPSVDPAERRLAMHVEDHPLDYGAFEGTIPAGQYGGGTVMLWDRGTWAPKGDARKDYASGHLKFELHGEKLQGGWMLVRSAGGKYGGTKGKEAWLLIKEKDAFAHPGAGTFVVDKADKSVVSGRSMQAIAAAGDRTWQSNESAATNVANGAVKPVKAKPAARGKAVAKTKVQVGAGSAPKVVAVDPRAAPQLAKLAGAKKAALPATLAPMLATLVKASVDGDDWLHEVKFDGYRMVARIDGGRVTLFSRNGRDWTDALPGIAAAVKTLPIKSGWLDGEVAVVDERGRTQFQALQNALSGSTAGKLLYFLFDAPFVGGYDLRGVALRDRKRVLHALLADAALPIRESLDLRASGHEVFRQACAIGLEGIISKRADSTYQSRRGRDWVKVKCGHRQEMVIGGFTDPQNSRAGFGALLLGVYADGALRYSGRVGTGFDNQLLTRLAATLRKLEIDKAPFANPPRGYESKGVHWVKPDLVGEVAFTEWTTDGTLRHPSFLGLRPDKQPLDVVREAAVDAPGGKADEPAAPAARRAAKTAKAPARNRAATEGATKAPTRKRALAKRVAAAPRAAVRTTKSAAKTAHSTQDAVTKTAATPGTAAKPATPRKPATSAQRVAKAAAVPASDATVAGITLSNPAKLYFPEAGLAKRDIAAYYARIAPWMLPHMAGRPLSLVRCPDGWQGECFYQKHAPPSLPAVVNRIDVPEGSGFVPYAEVRSDQALVALVQWGVLEMHPWGSRTPKLDKPDRLIFDFDPDDAVPWSTLVDSANILRTLLTELGLVAFIKTTGGKGLHVVVPIRPTLGWDTAKAFTRSVAEMMARTYPDRYVTTVSKARRTGKIFIDYLRNGMGATAVAPYGVRARKGAPVAMPIEWNQLDSDVRFDHFSVRNVPALLDARKQDPWADFFSARQAISAAMLRRVGMP